MVPRTPEVVSLGFCRVANMMYTLPTVRTIIFFCSHHHQQHAPKFCIISSSCIHDGMKTGEIKQKERNEHHPTIAVLYQDGGSTKRSTRWMIAWRFWGSRKSVKHATRIVGKKAPVCCAAVNTSVSQCTVGFEKDMPASKGRPGNPITAYNRRHGSSFFSLHFFLRSLKKIQGRRECQKNGSVAKQQHSFDPSIDRKFWGRIMNR